MDTHNENSRIYYQYVFQDGSVVQNLVYDLTIKNIWHKYLGNSALTDVQAETVFSTGELVPDNGYRNTMEEAELSLDEAINSMPTSSETGELIMTLNDE